MKNLNKVIAIAIVILGSAATSFAQTNSATQTASATVIKALTIENGTALNFGTFSGLSTATSKVVMTTAGARTGSTADLVSIGAGSAGTFTIKGESGSAISITMPSSTVTLVPGTSGDDMTILAADFTTDQGNLGAVTLTGGQITLKVGATLNVGVDQAADTYSGEYTVTVNYN